MGEAKKNSREERARRPFRGGAGRGSARSSFGQLDVPHGRVNLTSVSMGDPTQNKLQSKSFQCGVNLDEATADKCVYRGAAGYMCIA